MGVFVFPYFCTVALAAQARLEIMARDVRDAELAAGRSRPGQPTTSASQSLDRSSEVHDVGARQAVLEVELAKQTVQVSGSGWQG